MYLGQTMDIHENTYTWEHWVTELLSYVLSSLGASWQLHSNILIIATSNSYEFIAFYLMLIIYSCTPELFALKILSVFLIGNQEFRLQNSSLV